MSYYVSSGQVSTGIFLNNDDYMHVSGGTANSTTVNDWGQQHVSSGGTANSTTVNSWGQLYVYSGGMANNTTTDAFGYMCVSSGGTANSTITNLGDFTVYGTADATVVNDCVHMYIESGGSANSTTINSGGGLHVYSGARAGRTLVNQGGLFGVGGGANVVSTTVGEAGEVVVWGGGYAAQNVIGTWGAMILSSGAQAVGTDIHANGGLHIYAGAQADAVTIRNGATLGIGGEGRVNGITEEYGASMTFYEGSQVAGRLLMGGSVTVNGTLDGSNAEFVFDLTNRTGADGIILNSLQAVTNTSFQISVSSSQQAGRYALAGGAYAATLTLNVDSAAAGTLSVGGGALQVGDASCSLGLSGDGILYLEIARSDALMSAQLPEPALDAFTDDAAEPFSAASALRDADLGLDSFSNDTWNTAFLSDADILKFKPNGTEVTGMLA